MIQVLFVCLGNICRSPAAEGVFRELVARAGLSDQITTDSAGTGTWHIGNPPDERGQAAARKRGIDISDLRARQVQARDFRTFDYILAMDRRNVNDLSAISAGGQAHRVHLFLSFAENQAAGNEIPDPYYGGPEGFERALDLIEDASRGLLAHIREKHL